jgi:hypothetical protein
MKARQAHVSSELRARDRRIKEQAGRLPLCKADLDETRPCEAVATYLSRRRGES